MPEGEIDPPQLRPQAPEAEGLLHESVWLSASGAHDPSVRALTHAFKGYQPAMPDRR